MAIGRNENIRLGFHNNNNIKNKVMSKRKRIERPAYVSKVEINVVIKPQIVINVLQEDAIVIEGRVVGARSTDGRIIFVERYEDRRKVAKEIDEILSNKKVIVCTFSK
jgi:hypothetical protein